MTLGIHGGAILGPRIVRRECAYLGAHHGAIDLEEPQQGQAVVVAKMLQPAVQEPIGEATCAAFLQIHDQEGHLAGHVDPVQFRLELDPVEDGRSVLP